MHLMIYAQQIWSLFKTSKYKNDNSWRLQMFSTEWKGEMKEGGHHEYIAEELPLECQ